METLDGDSSSEARVNMECEGVAEEGCEEDSERPLGDISLVGKEETVIKVDVAKATGSTVTAVMGMLFGSKDMSLVREGVWGGGGGC